MTPDTPPPSADAAYLRRLLERQPACLIRVRLDGVLLACNDAALSLFGVPKVGAILQTQLTDRFTESDRAKWPDFAARVWANGAASLECRLVVTDDDARPLLVQGVALKDHPDGVESLLVNFRDQSQTHRLEHSIESAEVSRVDNEERQRAARDQIELALAESRRLAAVAEEQQAERQRLTEALAAQTTDHKRKEARFAELEKKVDESQLALLTKDHEYRLRIAALEAALAKAQAAQVARASAPEKPSAPSPQETATSERHKQELADLELRLKATTTEQARLRALMGDHEAQRERMAADHQAAVDTLEQSLALANEKAAASREQARQTLADLRSQLAQALAEQTRLPAQADEEHTRERERLIADHKRAFADLETSKRDALAQLRSQLTQAFAEQSRLGDRVEEHETERDRMAAAHQRAMADLETKKREALTELRGQQAQALAEQSRIAARAEEEHERERERMTAEYHRALTELETGKREALAALRAQMSQALAEQSRQAARAEEEHGRERDRVTAEQQKTLADVEASHRDVLTKLRAQLWQASSEERRLAARVEAQERERELMAIEQDRAIAEMETSKREALAGLRAQLSEESAAEQSLLTGRIGELEQERDGMAAEHRRAIADLQASKGEALNECERLLTDIQKALLTKDGFGAEVQRRLVQDIDEATRQKANQGRLERLQAELKAAVSEMQNVLEPEGKKGRQDQPTGEVKPRKSFWGHE